MSEAKLLQVSPEQQIYSGRFSSESVHLSAWKRIRTEDMLKLMQTGQRYLSVRLAWGRSCTPLHALANSELIRDECKAKQSFDPLHCQIGPFPSTGLRAK
ncbi:Uncharacterized protein DAT39_023095 [Clarias magur]|uniref:Uncharacterized protein n=1 Tax=Clarias magur TaxID=1594786 RepID=A0A8J4TA56_CLAMG|nr:Uncharacterized protein DAT39_023095 [Clarias magur]